MKCPQCQAILKDSAIFCNHCGRRLVERPKSGSRVRRIVSERRPNELPITMRILERPSGEHPIIPERPSTEQTTTSSQLSIDSTSDVEQPVEEYSTGIPSSMAQNEGIDAIIAAETREWALDSPLPTSKDDTPSYFSQGTVIAERYRITSVLGKLANGVVYEIDDEEANSKCWSCNAQITGDDQFCSECGAERQEHVVYLSNVPPPHADEAQAISVEDTTYWIFQRPPRDISWLVDVPEEPVSDQNPSVADLSTNEPATMALPADNLSSPTESISGDETESDQLATGDDADTMALPLEQLGPIIAHQKAEWQQNDAPTVEVNIPNYYDLEPLILLSPQIRVGYASDVGQSRRGKPNEDTAVVLTLGFAGDSIPYSLTLCLVADGLGGHDDGQRAGRLSARIITDYIVQNLWIPSLNNPDLTYDAHGLGEFLRQSIQLANKQIVDINGREGGDMGCTVTAMLAMGDQACIANVGDSRTYHYDGQMLRKVTVDHSLVARMVTAGLLTPDEVYIHPQRSQIYRSLGDEIDVVVDLFPQRIVSGDVFVLCSDGLWEMVRDPDLEGIMRSMSGQNPQLVAEQLVFTANAHGGDDNVTVVVAQVVI
jgi:serine/threonine protein phosphatase PrpC/rRNA maturation endonuclease Nob1